MIGTRTYRPDISVKKIRESLGLSQTEFAEAYCVPVDKVENWEQGQCTKMDAATYNLMVLIKEEPISTRWILRSHYAKR